MSNKVPTDTAAIPQPGSPGVLRLTGGPPSPMDLAEDSRPSNSITLERGTATARELKYAIVIPFSWDASPREFTCSLDALKHPGEKEGSRIWVDGAEIGEMRNEGIRKARDELQMTGDDRLLFVDADMQFDSEAFLKLADNDLDIVSGWCRKKRRPFASAMALLDDRDGRYYPFEPAQSTGLMRVDGAVGGAFICVKMKVFETVETPWFIRRQQLDDRIVDRDDFVGEDFNFCDRARKAGFDIYVDLDVKVGHGTRAIITTGENGNPVVLVR